MSALVMDPQVESENRPKEEIHSAVSRNKVLQYKNVDLYQRELPVLHGVNIEIAERDLVYLIGKTGSGKSTFLKSIYGELPIKNGEALVCGENLIGIKRKKLPALRRKIGMIFQDFRLLDDRSIGDNLLFVLKATGWKDKKMMQEKVDKALDEVGLKFKKEKFPQQLSGGEVQRVCIARALLNDPELIIADEPTGNLDPETSNEIIDLMVSLQQRYGAAILLATHDYRLLAEYPGSIIRCEDGSLSSF